MSRRASGLSRRDFVKGSAAVAGGLVGGVLSGLTPAATAVARGAHAGGRETLRIGVIGCGGRGTGAAINALEAAPNTEIVALADVFADRLGSCRRYLAEHDPELAGRVRVDDDHCFIGFDAYRPLLDAGVDAVILATPPHFRPAHFAAAVEKGKHVFMEKPVAVDPAGIRAVLAAGEEAERKGLAVVAGTQRRHENCYLAAMERAKGGAIGRIVSASCYWNQGGLWMHERQPGWSDMEWQLRNWLYFTWLSGDHIVEQHVHNLDVINWAVGSPPLRCLGMGGRQVRTSPAYGHVFDHFAVEYEYPGGVTVTSMCRQMEGTAQRVDEVMRGTEGVLHTRPGMATIVSAAPWQWDRSAVNNPYVQEHVDMYASIAAGRPLNEARAVAESTLTAIMGRMSAYTGQEVTWEQAMNSTLDLRPPAYEFGALPTPEVAAPGRTPLV